MECRICGSDGNLYQCGSCEVYFCTEHRLPDDHGCPPVISDDPPEKHRNTPRKNDEIDLIHKLQEDDWYYFADPPDWVVDAAKDDGIHDTPHSEYRSKVYYGDTYVYKAVSMLYRPSVHVFSRMKK